MGKDTQTTISDSKCGEPCSSSFPTPIPACPSVHLSIDVSIAETACQSTVYIDVEEEALARSEVNCGMSHQMFMCIYMYIHESGQERTKDRKIPHHPPSSTPAAVARTAKPSPLLIRSVR
jgi:hypothetical protein